MGDFILNETWKASYYEKQNVINERIIFIIIYKKCFGNVSDIIYILLKIVFENPFVYPQYEIYCPRIFLHPNQESYPMWLHPRNITPPSIIVVPPPPPPHNKSNPHRPHVAEPPIRNLIITIIVTEPPIRILTPSYYRVCTYNQKTNHHLVATSISTCTSPCRK